MIQVWVLCVLFLCFFCFFLFVFFFNDTATTEIYTLSLHDALPICRKRPAGLQVQMNYRCKLSDGIATAAAAERNRTSTASDPNGVVESETVAPFFNLNTAASVSFEIGRAHV